MRRIFAVVAVALATLFATAPASAQNGVGDAPYGLNGVWTITSTGFSIAVTSTSPIPAGDVYTFNYDLTASPNQTAACTPFEDYGTLTTTFTGNGSNVNQTLSYTFPTPLNNGYSFYGMLSVVVDSSSHQVAYPVLDSSGKIASTVFSGCHTPPTLTCAAVSSGTVGVPFDSGNPSVTGGTAPFVFSLASGTVVPGLTLNTSTGDVHGTPTAPGSFTIKVTDSTNAVAPGTCSITIVPTCVLSQFGVAGGYTVLGLQNANIQMSSGNTQVTGNIGLGQNGQLNFSGGGHVFGTLYADPSAHVQTSGGSSFSGGIVTQSMTGAQNAALAEASAIASMTPTQTLGNISSSANILGNGGQDVVQVGQIQINGGGTLMISGSANDRFYIIVNNGLTLTGGSRIVLNGVAPNQVVFYFPNNGENMQTNGNSVTEGIFLAPLGNIQISGGVHTSEFIAGNITLQSGPTVNMIPPCTSQNLALSCPVSTGTVGTPYNSSLVATGGVQPYMFSLEAGNLPNGLSLNSSSGAITGTPTAAGPFMFTAEVMDSSHQAAGTVTTNCSITTSNNNNSCVIPSSQTNLGEVSWNKFNPQGANNVVWVHMHIGTPSGIPTNAVTTVQFTGVAFNLNGTNYVMPNGTLIFNPSAPATPSTTFSPGGNGTWTTTFNPNNLSDEMFVDGSAIPVDSNISGGGQASITFTTTSSASNLAFSWQWSAAAYTYWPGANAFDNQANILPYHQSLHAGTPQNTQVQQSLEQGPRGGGGSNFTGSWSGTGHGSCPH